MSADSEYVVARHTADRFRASPTTGRLFARDMAMLAVTAAIVDEMARQGVSRSELALRIGKSKAFVSQVLNGSRNMTLRTMADLGWALGKHLHQVEFWELGTSRMSRERYDAWLAEERAMAKEAKPRAGARRAAKRSRKAKPAA